MIEASVAVSAGFVAIVASLAVLLAACVRQSELALDASASRARARAGQASILALAWLAILALMGLSGALLDFGSMPPRIMLVTVPPFLACFVLALTSPGHRLATGLPIAVLVGFQAFRVPVELVLHRLWSEGVIPVQMTWEGRNFDVLTGLSAIPVAWLASREQLPRWGLLLWNVLGLALLVNIVATAILCTPYPFRHFTEGPANEVVFHWPFVWLPGFVVPAALFGHLLVFRRLAER